MAADDKVARCRVVEWREGQYGPFAIVEILDGSSDTALLSNSVAQRSIVALDRPHALFDATLARTDRGWRVVSILANLPQSFCATGTIVHAPLSPFVVHNDSDAHPGEENKSLSYDGTASKTSSHVHDTHDVLLLLADGRKVFCRLFANQLYQAGFAYLPEGAKILAEIEFDDTYLRLKRLFWPRHFEQLTESSNHADSLSSAFDDLVKRVLSNDRSHSSPGEPQPDSSGVGALPSTQNQTSVDSIALIPPTEYLTNVEGLVMIPPAVRSDTSGWIAFPGKGKNVIVCPLTTRTVRQAKAYSLEEGERVLVHLRWLAGLWHIDELVEPSNEPSVRNSQDMLFAVPATLLQTMTADTPEVALKVQHEQVTIPVPLKRQALERIHELGLEAGALLVVDVLKTRQGGWFVSTIHQTEGAIRTAVSSPKTPPATSQ